MKGERVLLAKSIASAEKRLCQKLLSLDLKLLNISEYNQRYLGDKTKQVKYTLRLYGRLLRLSLSNNPADFRDFVFIDYGGGSGVLSFLAKELGIGTVIYNDIYDVSCDDVRRLSSSLELPLDHIVCGDIDHLVSYLHINSISANAIASYDVLEHIYDVESHLHTLAYLSEYDLRVVYASGANIHNPRTVRTLKKKHNRAEYQGSEKQWGSKERDALRPYLEIRREMINSIAPGLDSESVECLASCTRGLREDDIEKSVKEYLETARLTHKTDHLTNTCDPYTGNWKEHLIRTEWIEQILIEDGFLVKILPGYYTLNGTLPKRTIKAMLNIVIFLFGNRVLFISPYIVVQANKVASYSEHGDS